MKIYFKILFLSVVLIAAFATSIASPTDSITRKGKSKQFLGLEFGQTTSNMYGTEFDLQLTTPGSSFQTKPGIQLAFVFKNEFTNFIYLKTGMSYIQKKGYVTGSSFVY